MGNLWLKNFGSFWDFGSGTLAHSVFLSAGDWCLMTYRSKTPHPLSHSFLLIDQVSIMMAI